MNTAKTIRTRFNTLQQLHPGWSTYSCFANDILIHKYPQRAITRQFNKLVDKEDYKNSEKPEILQYLYTRSWEGLNQAPRENQLS